MAFLDAIDRERQHDACRALVDMVRTRLSVEDIARHSPGGPSHADSVRVWADVLNKGIIPENYDSDMAEAMGLTLQANPNRDDDVGLRWFRVFLNSVAAWWTVRRIDDTETPSRILTSLLWDSVLLNDQKLFDCLHNVFAEVHRALAADEHEEWPCATLAQMFLCRIAPMNGSSPEMFAERLHCEEQLLREQGERCATAVFGGESDLGDTSKSILNNLAANYLRGDEADSCLALIRRSLTESHCGPLSI